MACVIAAIVGTTAERANAQGFQPTGLEGNWLINWGNTETPSAAAVISRPWEQICVEVEGGGCRFENRRSQSDSTWRLSYSHSPYEHGGAGSIDVAGTGFSVQWGYGTLGGWGGKSELRQTGPNEIRGSWAYDTLGGGETWRRPIPRVTHVVFKGVTHYSYGMNQGDDSTARMVSVWTPGGKPGRVEGIYDSGRGWGPGNDMRGNRPKFRVEIYGENLWGDHLIDVAGARDLEPLPGWRYYILKDSSRFRTGLSPTDVIGIEADIVIWPNATPGAKALRIDHISVPFDLVFHGYQGPLVAERSRNADSGSSSATPLFLAGAAAGVGLAHVLVRRRRRRSMPPALAADLRNDVDATKAEFERLQQALRERIDRELSDMAEFDRLFNEKWVAAMQGLGEYIKLYPRLLPGITALLEQQGTREFARKVAEWVDFTVQMATLGQSVAKAGVRGAAGARGATAKQAEPVLGAARKPRPRRTRPPAQPKPEPRGVTNKTALELEAELAVVQTEVLVDLHGLNTVRGKTNCWHCALNAAFRLLRRNVDAVAENLPALNKKEFKQLVRREFFASFKPVGTGTKARDEIIKQMANFPDDTVGIVIVNGKNNIGHAFNVTKRRGHVVFPDAQKGNFYSRWDGVGKIEFTAVGVPR